MKNAMKQKANQVELIGQDEINDFSSKKNRGLESHVFKDPLRDIMNVPSLTPLEVMKNRFDSLHLGLNNKIRTHDVQDFLGLGAAIP